MTKNNQTPITVSLELAKRMKELGRNKPTHFWYVGYEGCMDQNYSQEPIPLYDDLKYMRNSPTAQEILDELPEYIHYESDDDMYHGIYLLKMQVFDNKYRFNRNKADGFPLHTLLDYNPSIAEAAGIERCRCKENGYLSN